jgi:hypothetical protein
LAKRYHKAGKKEKGAVLDEVVRLCGYSRAYAARRQAGKPVQSPGGRAHVRDEVDLEKAGTALVPVGKRRRSP